MKQKVLTKKFVQRDIFIVLSDGDSNSIHLHIVVKANFFLEHEQI